MTEKKKTYISPNIESERVDLPQAWACVIYNTGTLGGTWSGPMVNDPSVQIFVCD